MNSRRFLWIAGLGCTALVLIVLLGLGGLIFWITDVGDAFRAAGYATSQTVGVAVEGSEAVFPPTVVLTQGTEETPRVEVLQGQGNPAAEAGSLATLYQDVNPGVVNVRVYVARAGVTGTGAGSGFIFDEKGHIVTNHHVVAGADVVTVIFFEGSEVEAEIVGTDGDSDLAVVKVDQLIDGAHSLALGSSSAVKPGDWVIAIGNPFSLGGSMTLGIVSAVGRTIPAAETPFSIPSAIQTDAAINPGNSGGPLLTSDGRVVGVNAQIESTSGTNSGVGFAIPSDVVGLVVPALIDEGSYAWPWLGVTGMDVGLVVQQANDLVTQDGAYVVEVAGNSPASEAGLQGASRERRVLGQTVPVGGDVVLEADGEPIRDFTALLTTVAFKQPGDAVELTILRDGERLQVVVELAERPLSPVR